MIELRALIEAGGPAQGQDKSGIGRANEQNANFVSFPYSVGNKVCQVVLLIIITILTIVTIIYSGNYFTQDVFHCI